MFYSHSKKLVKNILLSLLLLTSFQFVVAKVSVIDTSGMHIKVLDGLLDEGLINQKQYNYHKQDFRVVENNTANTIKGGTASISGQITDTSGNPLNAHFVTLYNVMTLHNPTDSMSTDTFGNYSFTGLETGDYVLFTGANGDDYLHYVWQNALSGGPRLCHQCNNSVTPDSYINVGVGATVSGIDVSTQLGGVISGFIRDATTNAAVSSVSAVAVNINDNSYNLSFNFSYVDESTGEYKVTGIPNGTYKLYLKPRFDLSNEYIPQLYGGSQCNACAKLAFADQGVDLVIDSLNTLNNSDFTLSKGASISGKIVDGVTEDSLNVIALFLLFDELNHLITTHYIPGTNSNPSATGDYFIGGLLPGSYYLQGGDLGFEFYQREVYNNKSCYWSGCDRSTGDPLVLGDGEAATGIDFLLEKGGKIAGTITSAITGLPITDANVQVQFIDNNNVVVGGARAKADGSYISARALPPGDYAVRTGNLFAGILTQPYVNEKYNDIECSGMACDLTTADVNVTSEAITTGIDFQLSTGFSFSGIITDAGSLSPIPDVHVLVYKDMGAGLDPKFANWATTNDGSTGAVGSFEVSGLPAGTYYAVTNNGSNLPFLGFHPEPGTGWHDILYDGISCPAGGCDILSGTPIVLGSSLLGMPNYDMSLSSGATISGKVIDSQLSSPIVGVQINIFNPLGEYFGSFTTDESGFFKTAGLNADTYYLTTSSFEVLVDMKYGNTACYLDYCDPLDAIPIVVNELENVGNIDFILKSGFIFSNSLE